MSPEQQDPMYDPLEYDPIEDVEQTAEQAMSFVEVTVDTGQPNETIYTLDPEGLLYINGEPGFIDRAAATLLAPMMAAPDTLHTSADLVAATDFMADTITDPDKRSKEALRSLHDLAADARLSGVFHLLGQGNGRRYFFTSTKMSAIESQAYYRRTLKERRGVVGRLAVEGSGNASPDIPDTAASRQFDVLMNKRRMELRDDYIDDVYSGYLDAHQVVRAVKQYETAYREAEAAGVELPPRKTPAEIKRELVMRDLDGLDDDTIIMLGHIMGHPGTEFVAADVASRHRLKVLYDFAEGEMGRKADLELVAKLVNGFNLVKNIQPKVPDAGTGARNAGKAVGRPLFRDLSCRVRIDEETGKPLRSLRALKIGVAKRSR